MAIPAAGGPFTRYERQMIFPSVGEAGQARLAAARVGLIGCGALGSVIATHLVRSGVGYLRLVDRDYPQIHNLHRQILFTEEDVRRRVPKSVAAAEHLRAANSEVEIEALVADVNPFSIRDFSGDLDLLVDGTDNFSTRFLINDIAVSQGIPWIYGGVIGASGMSLTVVPGEGPCLRCLFRDPPPPGSLPTCDTAGVLSTTVAVIASVEANEALKLLVEPEARSRGLLSVDLWDLDFQLLQVERDPDCPCCGRRSFPYLEAEEEYTLTNLCGRNAVQIVPRPEARLDLAEIERRLSPLGPTRRNPFLVEVEVEGATLTIFPDGRALISGVDDFSLAQVLYARYIGQ